MIIDRLTRAMVSGELKPGDKLPTDTELAETIGVGRNSVREAIKIMDAFGILRIRRGDGIYVASEYHDGIVDPLLYGIIINSNEQKSLEQFRLGYLQSILIYGLSYFSETDIQYLKKVISSMKEDEKAGGELLNQKMYEATLEIEKYILKICNNRIMAYLDEIIIKLSKYSDVQKINNIIGKNQIDHLIRRYEEVVALIEENNKIGIIQFFDELQSERKHG